MCKKLVYLVSFVFVLSIASTSSAGLEGYWPLDGDLLDASGNGRHGTWMGDPNAVLDPNSFESGAVGLGLAFNGTDEYVNIDGYKGINAIDGVQQEFSIANWFKIAPGAADGNVEMVTWGTSAGQQRLTWRVHQGRLRTEHASGNLRGNTYVDDGEWHHGALVVTEGANLRVPATRLYVDGVEDTTFSGDDDTYNLTPNVDVRLGMSGPQNGRYWPGSLDEVYIFSRVLDADQVQQVMNGEVPSWPKADKASPADGAMLEEVSTFLNWRAGMGAVAHDVYFGTTADLGPDQLVSQQQTDTQYLAAGLVPDQTYYWRIDETDADGIVSTGDVWSIWTPPKSAYNPDPADGQPNLDTEADLSWTGGWTPIMHAVYFGTDADTVANAAGAAPQMDIGFDPGPLELETTYYWRVDEFYGTHWATGPVWSFSTLPPVPLTDDPNLVALYPLDEGAGKTAIDWSGHNGHGKLVGDVQWAEGIDGGALEFDGSGGDYAEAADCPGVTGTHSRTVTAWIKTADYGEIASWGQNVAGQKWIFRVQESNGTLGAIRVEVNGGYQVGSIDVRDDEWHHVAAVLADDGSPDVIEISLYVDSCLETVSAQLDEPIDTADGVVRIGQSPWGTRPFNGLIDDVHIYDKVFTRDEMRQTFGNVLLAWAPSPVNYETDVPYNAVLSWTPGDDAAQHDVYIGTDEQAVADADASDTTGIYQARQDLGNESFSPALKLEQTYYWRIDENNSDGTISKGRVWTFAVVDAIVVDDFEDYNDLGPNEIFATWIDGFGSDTNGALISSVETGIVHGGSQSMPYFYDNNLKYSEATMTLIDPRDWTEGGAEALSLWYRGYPASTGGFAEDPAGTYTMTASGSDIWGQADEFHFAYKQLPVGPCTIIAKVESVDLTNNWAKAGVMIRDTLDAGSKFAAVYITPTNDDGTATNGCRFQARLEADVDADSDSSVATDEQKAITAPYWVKLERGVVPFFSGYYSSDGVTWVPMSWNPQIIPMDGDIYIGLALTSHDAALTCEAVLSNVEITGTVGEEWTSQDIGISSNAREPMYVSIANQISPAVAVYNDDPNASTTDTWTEWVINLQDFVDQGVDLTDVDRISIGFGDKDNMQAGGSGMVYIDDIRLFRPPPYRYDGDTAIAGEANSFDSLDGTWDHDNGSDQWDGSVIGADNPGGVSALDGYILLQDTGRPDKCGMPDPSNRKIMFGHSITNDVGAAADAILDTGVTISFRARVATGDLLDPMYPCPDGDGENQSLPAGTAWPESGNGYLGHDGGKGNFSVRQLAGDMIISFSLALASESMKYDPSISFSDPSVGGQAGLVMNNLVTDGDCDPWECDGNGETLNILPLDPTEWHEYWITIEADATGTGTHLVKVYLDGSLTSNDFIVTAGNGNDYDDSYIGMGLGASGQMGAIDVDFVSYKQGVSGP